jgi:hypothetical protein
MKDIGNKMFDAMIFGGLLAIIIGHFKFAIEYIHRGDTQAGFIFLMWGLWLVVVLIMVIKTAVTRRKNVTKREEIAETNDERSI